MATFEEVLKKIMATFEEVLKNIQIKFKIFDLAVKENERIISRNKVNELVKQQKVFEKGLDEINDLKVAADEFLLEDDKSSGEVENWVKLHNEAVSKYDICRRNRNKVKLYYKIRRRERYRTRRKSKHRRMKEMQVQMREESQMREEAKANNAICKLKFPKLFITKFNGAHLDWFPF